MQINSIMIKRIAILRAMNMPGIPDSAGDMLEILIRDDRPDVAQFEIKGQYYNTDGSSASFSGIFPKAEMYSTMCSFDVGTDIATLEGASISIRTLNAEGAEV